MGKQIRVLVTLPEGTAVKEGPCEHCGLVSDSKTMRHTAECPVLDMRGDALRELFSREGAREGAKEGSQE